MDIQDGIFNLLTGIGYGKEEKSYLSANQSIFMAS